MIEIFLWEVGVEEQCIIDDLEIHIGDTPIRIPEAGHQERDHHSGKRDDELARPIEPDQTVERLRGVAMLYRLQEAGCAGHKISKVLRAGEKHGPKVAP
jgi:hypothetical protein